MSCWKDSWLSLDSEVSGVAMTDRIIAVGGVLCVNGTEEKPLIKFFNPGEEASSRALPEVFHANGTSRREIAKLGTFKEHLADVKKLLALSNVWVGHHISFDLERLTFEFQLAGDSIQPLLNQALVLDTRSLSGMILRATSLTAVSLNATAASWEVDVTPGGLEQDVMVVSRVFKKLLRFLPDDIEEMREVQRMAFRYLRIISGSYAPVLH